MSDSDTAMEEDASTAQQQPQPQPATTAVFERSKTSIDVRRVRSGARGGSGRSSSKPRRSSFGLMSVAATTTAAAPTPAPTATFSSWPMSPPLTTSPAVKHRAKTCRPMTSRHAAATAAAFSRPFTTAGTTNTTARPQTCKNIVIHRSTYASASNGDDTEKNTTIANNNNNNNNNVSLSSSVAPSSSNNSSSGASLSQGFLLRYQPALIHATKPKSLVGPFDVYDIPDIRGTIERGRRANNSRQQQARDISRHFFDELALNDYFSDRANWRDRSRFTNTSSFYSAVKVYLPVVPYGHLNAISNKYIAQHQHAEAATATVSSSASTVGGRVATGRRQLATTTADDKPSKPLNNN